MRNLHCYQADWKMNLNFSFYSISILANLFTSSSKPYWKNMFSLHLFSLGAMVTILFPFSSISVAPSENSSSDEEESLETFPNFLLDFAYFLVLTTFFSSLPSFLYICITFLALEKLILYLSHTSFKDSFITVTSKTTILLMLSSIFWYYYFLFKFYPELTLSTKNLNISICYLSL